MLSRSRAKRRYSDVRYAGAALALFAAATTCARANAGAWPMEDGRGQTITGLAFHTAERAYDAAGDDAFDAEFRKIETSVFAEYGLTSRITLVGRIAYQDVEAGVDSVRAFAATEIGARRLLARWRGGVVSAQLLGVFPGGGENVFNQHLGVGESGAEARLMAGRGWGDAQRGGFAEAQLGYRWRAGDDADEARLDVTAGWRIDGDWMIMGQSFSAWGLDGPAVQPDYESHRAQVSVVRRLNASWSLQAGGLGTYSGRDVIQERAVFLTLWRRY